MDNPIDNTNTEQTITAKQKFVGKVLKASPQGALIDIGAKLPAFLHVSQMVDASNPNKVLTGVDVQIEDGQDITVWVKRVHKDRIELTMREPLMYEWRELAPEMVVKGTVARLESFGAFVEIGAERPGLIHVSELSHNYVRVPSEAVSVGQEVEVKVLEVNRRKKQIKLSLKAMQELPEEEYVESPKQRQGRGKQEVIEEVEEEEIPHPTYMEIAMRKAMDRAEQRRPEIASRIKKQKKYTDEDADDIFERTIRNKPMSAGDQEND
jgi:predicted RNA-binding protein with RPS1 domain